MTSSSVSAVFEDYLDYIQRETDLKEGLRLKIRELDGVNRELIAVLQKIHSSPASYPQVTEQVHELFASKVRPYYSDLRSLFPPDQYYRYCNMWSFVTQRFVFAAVLAHYLNQQKLLSKEETAQLLGLDSEPGPQKFHLDLEDYLSGIIQVSNELARFTVNCVTHGDYDRPLKISNFLNDLNTGFRLLNLKNDNLRKRFDSLKYDMKKVEEVVYDLSIRGLVGKSGEDPKEEPKKSD